MSCMSWLPSLMRCWSIWPIWPRRMFSIMRWSWESIWRAASRAPASLIRRIWSIICCICCGSKTCAFGSNGMVGSCSPRASMSRSSCCSACMNRSIACCSWSISCRISSSDALRSSASASACWAARRSRSTVERRPSSIRSARSQSRACALVMPSLLRSRKSRATVARRPRKTTESSKKVHGRALMPARARATSSRTALPPRVSSLRWAMMARATGWLNVRSGRTKAAGSLSPVCPAPSRAVSVSVTGRPAQTWAVRSLRLECLASRGWTPGSASGSSTGLGSMAPPGSWSRIVPVTDTSP